MAKCKECGQDYVFADAPCKMCGGTKLVTNEKGKSTACSRCNGSGSELSAKNRNNRARGHSNERRLAKLLKEWWSHNGSFDFLRTPQSGGSKLKEGFNMAGDICTNAPDWPFHVEAKREKNWDFGQLLTAPKSCRIINWWDQANGDCPKNQITLVVFSPAESPITYVAMPMALGCLVWVHNMNCNPITFKNIAIFEFKTLLAIPPTSVLKMIERYNDPRGT